MKQDWTERLRQRLEGHKAEPPADLWENICGQMGLQAEPVSKPTAVYRRWYWAAAAAVLALVGLFTVLNLEEQSGGLPLTAEVVSQPKAPLQAQKEQATSPDPITERPENVQHEEKKGSHDTVKESHDVAADSIESPKEIMLAQTEENNNPVTEQQTGEQTEQQTDKKKEQQPDKKAETIVITLPEEWDIAEEPTVSSEKKWALSLKASEGLIAAQMSRQEDGEGDFCAIKENTPNDSTETVPPTPELKKRPVKRIPVGSTMAEVKAKHHLPVRLGVSVQYQLTPQIALVSGINYTYLCSDFSTALSTMEIEYTQKLHYLGIPVGISWKLLSAGNFRLYLSGQAMLEKCVHATSGHVLLQETERSKPWQFSLGAAVGAEYGITRQLGLYLEPSLGYFFDDGSSLEHYYKEHPWSPSVQFGLRLHVSK